MIVKDLIKQLLEFKLEMNVAFDAVKLTDFNGANGGNPEITSVERMSVMSAEYVLLKSNEI